MKTFTFKVTMTLDDEASMVDAQEYVKNAVRGWGGAFHPEDPFFGLKHEDIKVTRYRVPRQIK